MIFVTANSQVARDVLVARPAAQAPLAPAIARLPEISENNRSMPVAGTGAPCQGRLERLSLRI